MLVLVVASYLYVNVLNDNNASILVLPMQYRESLHCREHCSVENLSLIGRFLSFLVFYS